MIDLGLNKKKKKEEVPVEPEVLPDEADLPPMPDVEGVPPETGVDGGEMEDELNEPLTPAVLLVHYGMTRNEILVDVVAHLQENNALLKKQVEETQNTNRWLAAIHKEGASGQ